MSDKLISYRVNLTTVGPLHIGSGDNLSKVDYIVSGGTLYVIDRAKLYDGLKRVNKLAAFESDVLEAYNANMTAFVRRNNISPQEFKRWAAYSYSLGGDDNSGKMEIRPFVKDAYGLPYVPGSSLKGAVRNAVLNAVLLRESAKLDRMEELVRNAVLNAVLLRSKGRDKFADSVEKALNIRDRRNKYLSGEAKQLDKIFQTYNLQQDKAASMSNDIFRGLIVSDSKPLCVDDIILCRKVDMLPNGTSHKLNVLRECIRPGTVIEFTITINTDIFKYSIDTVRAAVKLFYNNQVDCFLSKYPSTQGSKGELIYLGGGSGFVSKTAVYSLFKDKRRGVKAAAKILDTVDSVNRRTGKKTGNHLLDSSKYGVAPHVRKCTVYNKLMYDFGLCRLDFQPIG